MRTSYTVIEDRAEEDAKSATSESFQLIVTIVDAASLGFALGTALSLVALV